MHKRQTCFNVCCHKNIFSCSPLFHRADDALDSTSLIIIQCDSGHQNSDLIACARYRIYDEALRARHRNKIQKQVLGSTHVMFIIRLPQQEVRSKFVGFQSDPWISVHIDDLKLSSQQTVSPEQAISAAISELFIGRFDRERKDIETISNIKPSLENSVQCTESDETGDSQSQESTEKVDNDEENGSEEISSGSVQDTKIDSASTVTKESILKEEHGDAETEKHFDFYPQHHRLYGCIQSAVSALRDSGKDRTKPRLQKLMCLVPREPTASVGKSHYNINIMFFCVQYSFSYTHCATYSFPFYYYVMIALCKLSHLLCF